MLARPETLKLVFQFICISKWSFSSEICMQGLTIAQDKVVKSLEFVLIRRRQRPRRHDKSHPRRNWPIQLQKIDITHGTLLFFWLAPTNAINPDICGYNTLRVLYIMSKCVGRKRRPLIAPTRSVGCRLGLRIRAHKNKPSSERPLMGRHDCRQNFGATEIIFQKRSQLVVR